MRTRNFVGGGNKGEQFPKISKKFVIAPLIELLYLQVGNSNIYIEPPINSEAESLLDEVCRLETPEDDMIAGDELLEVKVTHSIFDTSYSLVGGMKYQGIVSTSRLKLSLQLQSP